MHRRYAVTAHSHTPDSGSLGNFGSQRIAYPRNTDNIFAGQQLTQFFPFLCRSFHKNPLLTNVTKSGLLCYYCTRILSGFPQVPVQLQKIFTFLKFVV
jgi:hypothetical protein